MNRMEKLLQFIDLLPKNKELTEKDYREIASKIGDITEIADVFLEHAQRKGVNATTELQELAKARNQAGLNEAAAIVKSFSDIQPEKINWLWKNYIAIGKLTVFAGDPGLGKSQGTLDMAARLSKGDNFPDGSPGVL